MMVSFQPQKKTKQKWVAIKTYEFIVARQIYTIYNMSALHKHEISKLKDNYTRLILGPTKHNQETKGHFTHEPRAVTMTPREPKGRVKMPSQETSKIT